MSKYAFEGKIIRLNKKDYESWWSGMCYWMKEPDYLRTLSRIDDWLAEHGVRDRWFLKVSAILTGEKEKFEKENNFACVSAD